MKQVLALAIALVIAIAVNAQQFTAEGNISQVTRDGFYQIPLRPEVSAFANVDFSNIRLFNGNNVEIPYVLGINTHHQAATTFKSYAIEEKVLLKDSCTVIVLSNPERTTINNISLIIRNAAVIKEATLSGSDDKKTWYALKDRFQLGYIDNPNGTNEIQILDFPNSNYTFYRIVINDKESLPLNILNAGYYTTLSEDAKYYPVPARDFRQTNDPNKKKSYVRISFDTLHFIDRVSWSISGAPFYLRKATLYVEKERITKKGKTEKYLEYLADIQLNSHHENVIFLPTVKTNNLLLEIANDDNPPLVVSGVSVSQLARHLTAWLTDPGGYKLRFGLPGMAAPVYDLEYFRDSIPDNPIVLSVDPIKKLTNVTANEASATFFTNRYFIWVAILVVGIFLAFMSVRMVRETNAERE